MGQHTQGPWIVSLDPRYPNEPCIDAVIDGVVWHIALCHNAAGPTTAAPKPTPASSPPPPSCSPA